MVLITFKQFNEIAKTKMITISASSGSHSLDETWNLYSFCRAFNNKHLTSQTDEEYTVSLNEYEALSEYHWNEFSIAIIEPDFVELKLKIETKAEAWFLFLQNPSLGNIRVLEMIETNGINDLTWCNGKVGTFLFSKAEIPISNFLIKEE